MNYTNDEFNKNESEKKKTVKEAVELPCEIVCDILPVYYDGEVNEITAKAIDHHLEGCENCRKEYDLISKDLPQEQVITSSKANFVKIMLKTTCNLRKGHVFE